MANLTMNFDSGATFVTQISSADYFEVKDADGNVINSD
jgi:hypothetical protein